MVSLCRVPAGPIGCGILFLNGLALVLHDVTHFHYHANVLLSFQLLVLTPNTFSCSPSRILPLCSSSSPHSRLSMRTRWVSCADTSAPSPFEAITQSGPPTYSQGLHRVSFRLVVSGALPSAVSRQLDHPKPLSPCNSCANLISCT